MCATQGFSISTIVCSGIVWMWVNMLLAALYVQIWCQVCSILRRSNNTDQQPNFWYAVLPGCIGWYGFSITIQTFACHVLLVLYGSVCAFFLCVVLSSLSSYKGGEEGLPTLGTAPRLRHYIHAIIYASKNHSEHFHWILLKTVWSLLWYPLSF